MRDPEETQPLPIWKDPRRPVRLGWRLWAWLVVVLIFVPAACTMGGCATERKLTAEQDEAVHRECAPAGCRMVPLPIWRQIEQLLRQLLKQPTPETKEG